MKLDALPRLAAAFFHRGNRLCKQLLFQRLHVLADLSIEDLGVVLGSLQIPMPQHFGDRFDGDAVTQGDGRGERMPGNMKGQALVDPAAVGNLLQVGIHLLVAQDRQNLVLFLA